MLASMQDADPFVAIQATGMAACQRRGRNHRVLDNNCRCGSRVIAVHLSLFGSVGSHCCPSIFNYSRKKD